MKRWTVIAAVVTSLVAGCAEPSADPRRARVQGCIVRGDLPLLHARPQLVAGKYALAAADAYSYYRASLAVYLCDLADGAQPLAQSRFGLATPMVLSIGDAHPENFGLLIAGDGSTSLEPNDFDSATLTPYLYDLRRLAAGMVYSAHIANTTDPLARAVTAAASRSIALAVASGYAAEIARLAAGGTPRRITDDQGSTILADMFRRSARDFHGRTELSDFTVVDGTTRRFRRGTLDPASPDAVLRDLPAAAIQPLSETLARYRRSLVAPPPVEDFTVVDAVREMGSGVASWPRIRALVLLRGPSDDVSDDIMVEVKELIDAPAVGVLPQAVWFSTPEDRLIGTSRAGWFRPDADPLWSAGDWVGMAVQVRTESGGHKGVKVSRFEGSLGTPDAMASLGTILGGLLARVHASPVAHGSSPASAIAARIAIDPDGFANEQADVAVQYGELSLGDWQRFQAALTADGPLLGLRPDPADAPPPDLAALIGQPGVLHPL